MRMYLYQVIKDIPEEIPSTEASVSPYGPARTLSKKLASYLTPDENVHILCQLIQPPKPQRGDTSRV